MNQFAENVTRRAREALVDYLRTRLPRLVVSQHAVNKMVAAAYAYAQDETGEAMVGLVMADERGGPDCFYILDTVAPDESAERAQYMVAHGDTWQEDIVDWLRQNWRFAKQRRASSYGSAWAAKWNSELKHLGDWHKQPGFMTEPSGGDYMTALELLHDPERNLQFLLAPIVTVGHPAPRAEDEPPPDMRNYLLVPHENGTYARIDFWYLSRALTRLVPGFLPIVPEVWAADQFPRLAAHPWHLADEARAVAEHNQLTEGGMFVTMVLWNADDKAPLEICFMSARLGSSQVLILVTPYNYPQKPPQARVAPFIGLGADDDLFDVFEEMWARSEKVPMPSGFTWTPDKTLYEFARAIEASLGIEPTMPPPPPPPTPVVTVESARGDGAGEAAAPVPDDETAVPTPQEPTA